MLTPEDRYYLDAFLRRVLFDDDFSYVFFGAKPLAFTSYPNSIPLNVSYDSVSVSNLKVKKGLAVFKRLQPFFSSRKIIIRFYDYPDEFVVLMINRKNLISAFDKYSNHFKQVLGSEITSRKLIDKLVVSDDFGSVIKNHEALLGILLGYGGDNSWLFYNRKMMLLSLHEFDLSLKKKVLLEKEITKMNQQLKSFSIQPSDRRSFIKNPLISLPHFMADSNSLETKELKEKYEKDREKIVKIFAKQRIIDVVLQQMMDE